MALTKASDILGLRKKVEEFAVPIDSLSASKVTVDLPDFTATNAAEAFEELKQGGDDFKIVSVSVSVNTSIRSDWHESFDTGIDVPAGYMIGGFAIGNIPNANGHTPVSKCYDDGSGNVCITLCNSTGYAETVSGNLTGAIIFIKTTTNITKKKTTKKGGK